MGNEPSDRREIPGVAYRYLLEEAPVLLLLLDREGGIEHRNRYAEDILGAGGPGQPFTDFIVDFSGSFRLNDFTGNQGGSVPLSVSTASGMPQTFTFSFFDVGERILALGRLDLEEQARLQEQVLSLNRELNNLTRELHRKNAELARLNATKNQFLGMAAHDLRKPVGICLNYSEFLLEEAGAGMEEEHRAFLEKIRAHSVSMGRLIDGFLDVSMIESGRFHLDLQPALLGEAVERAVSLAEIPARKKAVSIASRLAPEIPRLVMDAPKVEQALGNLLVNAVEHSPEGASVSVECTLEGGQAVISVADQGPGIAPEVAERIFQPFQSGRPAPSTGGKNAGLGLAIANKIVTEHGGRFWVDSTPGRGATFRFSLPVDRRE